MLIAPVAAGAISTLTVGSASATYLTVNASLTTHGVQIADSV